MSDSEAYVGGEPELTGFIPVNSDGAVKAASGRLQGSLLLKAVLFKDEDCGAAECGEPAPKNSTFMSGSGLYRLG